MKKQPNNIITSLRMPSKIKDDHKTDGVLRRSGGSSSSSVIYKRGGTKYDRMSQLALYILNK